MLPTPTAMDANRGDYTLDKGDPNKRRASLRGIAKMWPTPNASDCKGAGSTGVLRDRLDYAAERGETKTNQYPAPPPEGGQLNPEWVEWLMGYPIGWTDLGASGTPSSRRSLKRSDG